MVAGQHRLYGMVVGIVQVDALLHEQVKVDLDDGKVIGVGTHQSLLAQRGRYDQLYTGQFELI